MWRVSGWLVVMGRAFVILWTVSMGLGLVLFLDGGFLNAVGRASG